MEDAVWERTWGLRACFPRVPHPCPPPRSLAPTWAYPCRLLRLPILAASAPPRHLHPQTCGGPGWGSGDHCCRAPGAPPAAAPALTTVFDTTKGGAGRGTQKQVFPKGRRLGPSSPSPPAPQEGPPFSAATRGAAAGRGGCGLCTASPRGSPTPPPRGLHGPGPLPHQPRGAPRGPLPAPPPPPPPPPGAAPGPHALRDTASRRREGSERRPGLTLERGARESALAGHVSLSSRRAATPPSRPPPGPRGLAEPSARVPAPVLASLLTAPAWGLSPSLLCVFLDLSLPPGKGSIFSGARGPSQLLLWGLASSLPSSQDRPPSICCSFCYQCSPFSLQ